MSNFDEAALFILILVPLLGAVLIMFMPKDRPKDIWYLAILVAGISLVLSLIIFARYDYKEGGFQFLRTFDWIDQPFNIDLSLGIDGISAPLILLNGIVLFGGVLVSQTILHRNRVFFVLLLALGAGVFGVFAARDLFFLFFFYKHFSYLIFFLWFWLVGFR